MTIRVQLKRRKHPKGNGRRNKRTENTSTLQHSLNVRISRSTESRYMPFLELLRNLRYNQKTERTPAGNVWHPARASSALTSYLIYVHLHHPDHKRTCGKEECFAKSRFLANEDEAEESRRS